MDLDEAAGGRLLSVEDMILAMEHALADFSNGKVVQPLRQIVSVAEHGGFLDLMPACRIYRWCPECVVVECDCGRRMTLKRSEIISSGFTCEECRTKV